MEPDAPSNNARTVASYEQVAADYARGTAGEDRVLSGGLERLAVAIPGGHALEIGSGPGWDADALEKAGLTVRRTDVTLAFLELQRARGRQVERLDVVLDDLGGPYDGVVALHVLQHVEPDDLPSVLAKVAGALHPGGRFLVSVPLGEGAEWEVGESGHRYFRSLWSEQGFVAALAQAGLAPEWTERSADPEPAPEPPAGGGPGWLCVLARPD